MKAKKLNKVGCLTSKISLVCLLPAFCIGTAHAQLDQGSKLYFQPEVLNLGQETTLSLMLDNGAEKVATMDFVIQLPEYVDLVNPDIVSDNLIPNPKRVDEAQLMFLDKVAGTDRTYKLTVFPQTTNISFAGESGKLADLKLKIDPKFLKLPAEQQTIKFSDVSIADVASRRLNDQLLPEAGVRENMRYVMEVDANVGVFSVQQQLMPVFSDNQEFVVDVELDNKVSFIDASFDLKLPEGMELAGSKPFINGARIPDHRINYNYVAAEKVTHVVINNMALTPIKGTEKSHLFSFKVKATDKLAAQPGSIVLSNLVFSDTQFQAHEIDASKNVVIKVQNLVADYNEVLAKIEGADGLNKRLEATIAEVAKLQDVGKEWASAENAQQKAIVAAIAALKADLEKTKLAQTEAEGLLAKKPGFLAEAERIQGLIATYLEDAKAAQVKFENDHTANNKVAVENYKKQLAELKAGLFEEVKAEVAAYQHKGDYSAAIQKVADMIAVEETHLAQPEYVGPEVNLDVNNYEEGSKITVAIRELQKAAADAEFAHLLALGYNEGAKALQNVEWNAAAYVDADQAYLQGKNEKLVAAYGALAAEYRGLKGEAFVNGFQALLAKLPGLNADVDALRAFVAENKIVKGCFTPGAVKPSSVDYMALMNVILQTEYSQMPSDPTSVEYARYFSRADVNSDKELLVSDLTLLIKKMRGLVPTGAAPVSSVDASGDHIALAVAGQGSAQRIAVLLNNAQNYIAAQMDITLPEGVKLVGESLGSRACGHDLYSNDLQNGAHRIVVASMDNNVISGNDGAVLYLDVEVDDTYQGAAIEVNNIVFADEASNTCRLNSVAGGEATGIGDVTLNTNGQCKVYNLGGQLQNGLNKGVNIVKMKDGSVKKIYRN